MLCFVIPAAILSVFNVTLPGAPCVKVSPVMIYTGTSAGSYAINAAILNCCPEWVAFAPQFLALIAANSIQTTDIDPAALVNPNTPS